ncbi:FUSC family protein [Xanthomonas oryzae pv. oryzae]|nr:FUSC family protein [Xanthomonas oryzae]ACD61617.1 hypothetical protein PXO_03532 [Xanthomonas oryzae pv. oryzae PXO99A]AJQ85705.1 hypothetical protein AZ54_24270 [Xanthomonas oryzae pv. oryzae PXO86]ALZ73865.1 hypothetical protein APZ20_22765 [Xanthomonas oryzae pv. oryzae]AOS04400.1 hypothetical protein ATY42_22460 [Xanthomonas oryzae pv. oryzae]AOS08488.1 hypothetical protein ATY43_23735 [Xanthomonas oryzae pv. oryzae]
MNAFLRDRQAWLFSVKTFAALIAALYVALAGNLSRPCWAMATVYIVSQPLLGPTRAKGVYRVLGTLSDLASVDMLNAVRVGLNILQLRSARHGLPASSRDAVDAILRDVAAHYRQQVAQKRPLPGPDPLRDRLDASLTRVGKVPAGASRDDALLGLMGLRDSLFANIPAKKHGVTEQPPVLAPLPSGR